MHRVFFVICGLSALSCTALGEEAPSKANLGKKIVNVSLKDVAGKTISLHDFKNRKAIVVVFLSFDCPVSNSYCEPLAEMAKEFGKHGIAFLGLTTNADESDAEIAKHVKEFNLPFPVACDRKLAAAQALQAEITPECFVLDGDFVLRYRGRIDNTYSERLKKHPKVTQHNLKQALGEILSGRPIGVPATVAIGCPIPKSQPAPKDGTAVTYYRDVAPILQNHCQTCHRPGEVGPFSLMTYRQAVNWAEDVKSFTQRRIMPPWKPSAGQAFHSDRRLSDKEIATLAAWVDAGTPAGDVKDAPPPRKFPQGWQLGKPDMVLTVADDFTLGPTGRDHFRCYVLPTNLKEDTYVVAIEVRPRNPRIVHHTLQFIDALGQGRKLEQKHQEKEKANPPDPEHPETRYDRGPGYAMSMGVGFIPQGGLLGWAPGQMPRYLPDGAGFLLPKNSDIVMQVHYHRNGKVEKDRPQIGLYFAKKTVKNRYQGGVIPGRFLSIPAGEERHHVKGDMYATGPFTLYSVMPHMHLLGKDIKVTVTPAGGTETTLIHINEWDYNWQETYFLKTPMKIEAGARFHVDAYYDNSKNNPNNPFNPPQRVFFGEQTTNEMCFVFLGGTGGAGGRRQRLPMSVLAPGQSRDKKKAD